MTDFLLAVAASVVAAFIVWAGAKGRVVMSAAAQEASRAAFLADLAAWEDGSPDDRQRVIARHIFGVLKWLFIGNVLWLLPEMVAETFSLLHETEVANWRDLTPTYFAIAISMQLASAGAFFWGVGIIFRFSRIVSHHSGA